MLYRCDTFRLCVRAVISSGTCNMLSQMSATEVANRAPLGARTDSFAFWWLITMAALVGVMVLIGGVTRLS